MRPETLKSLDRYFWRPAAIAGKAIRRMHSGAGDHRPVIVRPGGMGDLIMMCIAAEELGIDPRAFFWVIETRSAQWARHLGLDFLCYDTARRDLLRLRGQFRTVINSEQYFGLSQAAALALRAPGGRLIGFRSNRGANWNDIAVDYDSAGSHETVEFSRILAHASGLALPLDRAPSRPRRFEACGDPVVGIAGLQNPSRRFSLRDWAAMVKNWAAGRHFTIIAAPQDSLFALALSAEFRDQAQIFSGSFEQVCGAVRQAPEIFTVEGGLTHVASYYGVPAVAVFTSSIDAKWAPLARGSQTVKRTDLSCRPCAKFAQVPGCGHGYACKRLDLLQISPEHRASERKETALC